MLTIKPDACYRQNPHPTYNAFQIRNLTKAQARDELMRLSGKKSLTGKLLLFFGFVREYKGLRYLIQAMHAIREQLDDITLLVVGAFGSDKEDYLRLKDSYILTPEKLEAAKPDLSILHPLPRVNEVSVAVDKDPRAAYFRQVRYGRYIRMALIMKLLGIE